MKYTFHTPYFNDVGVLGKPAVKNFPASRQRDVEETLAGKPRDDRGRYKLGVQDLFRVLEFSEIPALGQKSSVHGKLSKHLSKRNESLLAHGVRPVSEDDFKSFWKDTLEALDVDIANIPRWPELDLKLI